MCGCRCVDGGGYEVARREGSDGEEDWRGGRDGGGDGGAAVCRRQSREEPLDLMKHGEKRRRKTHPENRLRSNSDPNLIGVDVDGLAEGNTRWRR